MAMQLGLSPHMIVSDADAAIAFYKKAFGAVQINRSNAPNSNKVMHALLKIHGSLLSISDDFSESMGPRKRTPEALGGTPILLHLQVADAEAAWEQAMAAGVKVSMPLKEQFWGEKYGSFHDPFGHEWSIAQMVRELSEQETEHAAEAFFKKEPVAG